MFLSFFSSYRYNSPLRVGHPPFCSFPFMPHFPPHSLLILVFAFPVAFLVNKDAFYIQYTMQQILTHHATFPSQYLEAFPHGNIFKMLAMIMSHESVFDFIYLSIHH